mgnify:CR=1 FL=1
MCSVGAGHVPPAAFPQDVIFVQWRAGHARPLHFYTKYERRGPTYE